MEKWDLYNENRLPLNKTHVRGEKMMEGEYNIVVTIWTVNSNNEILLTLRDPNKEYHANFWENTGGAVLMGETSKEGAIRELIEETGIEVDEKELFLLGTEKTVNSFIDTYIIKKDISISDLTLQEGETVDAKWITIDKLDKMIENKDIALPVSERLNSLREEFEKFLFKKNN